MNNKMNFNSWINTGGHKTIIGSNISNCQTLVKKFVMANPGTVIDDYTCTNLETIINEITIPHLIETVDKFEVLNADQAASVFYNFLNEKKYNFIPKETICLETAKSILSSINQIRLGKMKKDATFAGNIVKIIKEFEDFLSANNYYDYPKLLEEAKKLLETKNYNFGDVGVLENTILASKELEFIKKVTNDKFVYLNFLNERDFTTFTAKKIYGYTNEARNVVLDVIAKNHSFGDVVVYYSDPIYENILDAIFTTNDIPHKFISSKHISSSNYVSLILGYLDFYLEDYKYEILEKVVNNPLFSCTYVIKHNDGTSEIINGMDAYSNLLSNVSIGYKKENYKTFLDNITEIGESCEHLKNNRNVKFYEFLKKLISIDESDINKSIETILNIAESYSIFSKEKENLKSSIIALYKLIKYRKYDDFKAGLHDVKNYFLNLTIKEAESTDSISCATLGSFDVIDRKFVYVIGLQASSILKKEVETPLISNDDLTNNLEDVGLVLSKRANEDFERTFNETINSADNDASFVFSYSCFNSLENRQLAPSNFILNVKGNIGKEDVETDLFYENVKVKDGERVVFDSKSFDKLFAKAPAKIVSDDQIEDETEIKEKAKHDVEQTETFVADKPYSSMSASDLQTLANCPYAYYYKNILGIPEIAHNEINGMKWLEANQRGTIFHAICEEYFKAKSDLRDAFDSVVFEEKATEIFNKYTKIYFGYNKETINYEFSKIKNGAENYIKTCVNSGENKFVYGTEIPVGRSTKDIKQNANFEHDVIYKGELPDCKKEEYVVHFHGNVDRADYVIDENTGTVDISVVDYKSSATAKSVNALEKSYKQHIIYPVGVATEFVKDKTNKISTVGFEYVFPLCKGGLKHVPMIGIDYSDVKLGQEIIDILNITEGYRLNGYSSKIDAALDAYFSNPDRRKGIGCGFCKMKNVCKLNLRGERGE